MSTLAGSKLLQLALCFIQIGLLFHRQFASSFCPSSTFVSPGESKRQRRISSPAALLSSVALTEAKATRMKSRVEQIPKTLLIHWKGEDGDTFGSHFRLTELKGALAAILNIPFDEVCLDLSNALEYTGVDLQNKPIKNVESFNSALQYIHQPIYPRGAYMKAIQRCSLVHALYEVEAVGESFKQVADMALHSDGFDDMKRGRDNDSASWSVRVRHFGESSGAKQDLLRYGGRTRSVTKEKEACIALKQLLLQFGGNVDLKEPVVKIYLFDGLSQGRGGVVLTRRLANAPQISGIDPNTRICVTNTPLVPIAAYLLCNAACLHAESTILDPYAGSGTILLAAAMIEPSCRSVGIEIAHDGLVNREHIRQDFATRHLPKPLGLLLGDCTNDLVRSQARELISGDPFDCIISDPPYGIRESTIEMDPLSSLLNCIIRDREKGTPLVKKGGMLVCFVPCRDDQALDDVLPNDEQLSNARLRPCAFHEQPLNKKLSRWLVSYVCDG